MKEEIERRRMEAAEKRMKNLNDSATDGDDPFNPLNPKSPTAKVTHFHACLCPPLSNYCGDIVEVSDKLNKTLPFSDHRCTLIL